MALEQSTTANADLFMWAVGGLCAMVGTLMLIILNRVLKQGDDTNQKVTAQTATLERVDTKVNGLEDRVSDLHQWKNEQMRKEAEMAAAEVIRLRDELRARGTVA